MLRFLTILLVALLSLPTITLRAEEIETDLYEQAGNPEEAKKLVDTIAGVYEQTFHNPDISEVQLLISEYILELVKISDTALYFKTKLVDSTGHQCFIFGVADYKKVGGFVAVTKPEFDDDNKKCYFTIKLTDNGVTISTTAGSCRYGSHRLGGGLGNDFPITEKRKIRYMQEILDSADYKNALDEYHKLNSPE
jgi:hypothetical protein